MKNYNEIYERIAALNNVVIASTEFQTAFHGIQQCAQRSRAFGEPIGSVLKSEGGLGKTTLCRAILERMPKSKKTMDGYEKTIIPAFYVEVPSPVTVKSLASTMLRKLGDPTPLQGTTAHLTNRLSYLLTQCETRLVFLDEFHHLFDRKSSSTKLNVTVGNWLKTLVNETGISFCLVGLPEFVDLLEVDSQIARRFQYRFELNPLSIGRMNLQGTLYPFLNQFALKAQEKIQVTFSPALDSHLFGMQIYTATKGYHAFVMSIIRESIAVGLAQGRNTIVSDDFSQVWQQGITSFISSIKANPFQMSMTQLATYLRGNV